MFELLIVVAEAPRCDDAQVSALNHPKAPMAETRVVR
jgi:hypothetical protein